MAALTRFISKAIDRCAHFFKSLKRSKKYITWTDECAETFKNLTDYMSKAHLLSKPEVGDTLIIYLSVSASAVSSVLIRKDGNVKRPVYYASKALQDAKTRYSNIDQDRVKQNQFMVPTKASSNEFNHNSQKLHTLWIKTV
ncbi:hypothetical protein ACFX2J_044189 [Malus domestica]